MRALLLAFLLLLPLSSQAYTHPKPTLMAVYFYADWCGQCKILSPKFAEARKAGGLDKKNILFVTMNLTDKTTIHQSILLAQALGIGDYLKAQGSKTGYIALLDAESKKEIIRFDSDNSSDGILKTIQENLQ